MTTAKKVAKKAVKQVVAKKSIAKKGASVAATYRRVALALPHAVEDSHRGAADFRIEIAGKRRIFATLAYESKGLGTLMLDAEQQTMFLAEAPECFSAVRGGWERRWCGLMRQRACWPAGWRRRIGIRLRRCRRLGRKRRLRCEAYNRSW
jgi:hypothetical protein